MKDFLLHVPACKAKQSCTTVLLFSVFYIRIQKLNFVFRLCFYACEHEGTICY